MTNSPKTTHWNIRTVPNRIQTARLIVAIILYRKEVMPMIPRLSISRRLGTTEVRRDTIQARYHDVIPATS